jgi:hypothetical protein
MHASSVVSMRPLERVQSNWPARPGRKRMPKGMREPAQRRHAGRGRTHWGSGPFCCLWWIDLNCGAHQGQCAAIQPALRVDRRQTVRMLLRAPPLPTSFRRHRRRRAARHTIFLLPALSSPALSPSPPPPGAARTHPRHSLCPQHWLLATTSSSLRPRRRAFRGESG